MITVCCLLWSDPRGKHNHLYRYTPEHVRLLRNQVSRHLHLPYDFVCLTDVAEPIGDGIRQIPLDMRLHVPGTRFLKLQIFAPEAKERIGKRILCLDLDTVIVGNITPLVASEEDLVLWRNPNFGIPKRAFYNTSIILLKAGSRPEFWTKFRGEASWREAQGRTNAGGTDQCWISYLASRDEAHWTADDGVFGAGRLGDYHPDLAHTVLPENARIVFFPGRREPGMPTEHIKHPWIEAHRW